MSKKVELKNIYNFKNPIRHFFNANNILFPDDIDEFTTTNLSWTAPIKFRIKKGDNEFRTLKFPNFLNFCALYLKLRNEQYFFDIHSIDNHKRIEPNLETGDFVSNSYSNNLEKDFDLLCIYDNLIKIDIRSFYGRLYLHDLDLEPNDVLVNNLNKGKTNELILGNYISLFIAERFLKKISDELTSRFEGNVDCKFSYFSDDFYFFCNQEDSSKVIKIFSEVLEKYELEINDKKTEFWNYEEYSDLNLVEKYWKTIVSDDKRKVRRVPNECRLYFGFINQLIYRKSKLKSDKLKKIFVNNFFKSTYFNELDFDRYELQDFNCHQLFSIFKYSPETLLYTVERFKRFENFKIKIKDFLSVRFKCSLQQNFYEEQLYYYYSIRALGYNEILINNKALVKNSNNQVLMSYFVMNNIFTNDELDEIMCDNEELWFINYHCLLKKSQSNAFTDEDIVRYLVPKYALSKECQKNNYLSFYKINIENGISFINSYESIKSSISDYIDKKIEERNDMLHDFQDLDEDELA